MAFCQMHFFSDVLVKQVGLNVILPDKQVNGQVDGGRGPFPTFYLLHGLSDDYTIWHRRTRIEWYVRDLPLIVVMPDGFRGFYTNNNEGPRYADFFTTELPNFIERIFPAKRNRAGRAIGGLSMGGYGALRIALGAPDRFISANSHSGALLAGSKKRDEPEFGRILGADPAGSDHDLLTLAQRAKRTMNLPQLLIDCGKDDFLIDDNRAFHAALKKQKIAHEYREFPGAHDWDYWDEHVRDALKFHARALKLKSQRT
ncbi:MAG: esterase family protein [Anaerolineae bacterium]|nr:esterase family protein [Phycisphaerae bacterium]